MHLLRNITHKTFKFGNYILHESLPRTETVIIHSTVPAILSWTASLSTMDRYVTRKVLTDDKKKEEVGESQCQSQKKTSPTQQKRFLSRDSKSNNQFKTEKEKYLNMPKAEKRKVYKSQRFHQFEDISTWQEFYTENEEKLQRRWKGRKPTIKAESNESFNNKLSLWRGDITALEIDSIANAANNSLLGGGGVDGAIHSAAGGLLVQECASLNGCDTGDAVITGGYRLPAKYVIHTVGPIGEIPDKLKSCYLRCLDVMTENNLRSIAFPCISTGIYGYPSSKAAEVVLSTMRKWLEHGSNADKVDRIIFCLFMPQDVVLYEELMQLYFPVHPEQKDHDNGDMASEANISSKKSPDKKESPNPSVHVTRKTLKDSEESLEVENSSSSTDVEPAAKRKPPLSSDEVLEVAKKEKDSENESK